MKLEKCQRCARWYRGFGNFEKNEDQRCYKYKEKCIDILESLCNGDKSFKLDVGDSSELLNKLLLVQLWFDSDSINQIENYGDAERALNAAIEMLTVEG
jgi:Tfp pilus assembly protein PilX